MHTNYLSYQETAIHFNIAGAEVQTNFIKNLLNSDTAFFVTDYNKRLRDKFNSLSNDLQEELSELYNFY